ncbi:glycosyltransferase family 4 protein [Cyanobacterium sp. IPPAS B-1200]|uniref:glycosyltransferase family 4 protein n=1 Tax=Cyanobacterium sp. IPPAS B-1200 TaxID=1562720 RepID=UPI003D461766
MEHKKPDHLFLFLEVFIQEGGIQSYVKDVLRGYQKLDYRGQVFVLRDKYPVDDDLMEGNLGFEGFFHASPMVGRIRFIVSFFLFLLINRPQRVFCGHIKLGGITRLFCGLFNIPYTVLTYGKEVWDTLPPKERQVLDDANQILTISRYSCDRIYESNKIEKDKIDILPCVVDADRFTIAPKPKELIEKYNLGNSRVLLTVARLWSGDIYKGVDVTIRALPKILETYPDVKYLVVGRGDDKARLKKLTQDLGIENKVIFAGFIPTSELVSHYQVCNAYIMPSQEGFGIVYLEAMACGKPVLSGDNDGSADPLQDGRLGWRVPHRDADGVASACIEILQGKDPRCHGEWLREETVKKFSLQVLDKRLMELIEN